MTKPRSVQKSTKMTTASSLMVRLDEESKGYLSRAAAIRHVSISDYVRTVAISQARREVLAAREQIIGLTPQEQLAFWSALHRPTKLTAAQRRLGKVMRGEL